MKVSIIVPVYNSEEYISDTIESVLNQSFADWELILVDDGSTDSSPDICDRFTEADGRIRCIHTENRGPARARNIGIGQATGEYIQFLDADDLLTPDCCEMLNKAASDYPDIIVGDSELVNGNRTVLRHIYSNKDGTFNPVELLKEMTVSDKEIWLHYIWNKWYRRDIIENNNIEYIDVRLGEDFLFNCAVWQKCNNVKFTGKVMYYYFKRDAQSLTGQFRSNELERRRLMDSAFIDMLKKSNVYEQGKCRYDAMIGEICLNSLLSVGMKNTGISYMEKRGFIKSFLKSEYYGYLLSTACNQSKVWKRIMLFFVKIKFCEGIMTVAVLKARRCYRR